MDAVPEQGISLQVAAARGIAAVEARLQANRVPVEFARHLDQVYAAARAGAITLDGQNIFVYRDAGGDGRLIDVEFGVGVAGPFAAHGAVHYSQLPTGPVATATHWGDYAGLGATHRAVIAWCRAHERVLAGPRWEIYGHWNDDPRRLRTDVYYLLQPAS